MSSQESSHSAFPPVRPPNRVRLAAALVVAIACVVLLMKMRSGNTPANGSDNVYLLAGETMGTTYNVKVVLPPGSKSDAVDKAKTAVDAALEKVNALMSTWRPDSELSRFNQFSETTPFKVSPETIEVFELSQAVSEASSGTFDITVGPLVNAWGFGPDDRTLTGPSEAELAALRERVGYRNLTIDPAALTLRKARPDIYCDLSAVAKGYGVDCVAKTLEGLGLHDYMVEVGGEVRTRGTKNGASWRIAIERPLIGGRDIERVVAMPVAGLSMATSGDYRNYYEVDGVRLSHTIDPRTGRPITHNLASASVLCATCAEADAYATALMVLGPDEGFALACKLDLAALLIIREAPDQFVEKATPAFQRYE